VLALRNGVYCVFVSVYGVVLVFYFLVLLLSESNLWVWCDLRGSHVMSGERSECSQGTQNTLFCSIWTSIWKVMDFTCDVFLGQDIYLLVPKFRASSISGKPVVTQIWWIYPRNPWDEGNQENFCSQFLDQYWKCNVFYKYYEFSGKHAGVNSRSG